MQQELLPCEEHTAPSSTDLTASDWEALLSRVQQYDKDATDELARRIYPGLRWLLYRRVGCEAEDLVQETFLLVIQAVHAGALKSPEALPSFTRTIAQRQVLAHISRCVGQRKTVEHEAVENVLASRHTPELEQQHREQVEFMEKCLRELSARDRQILTMYYLDELPMAEICATMGLTETQFRLLKSRAKARFGEAGQRALKRRPVRRAEGTGTMHASLLSA